MLFSALLSRAIAGLAVLAGSFQLVLADTFENSCRDLKRSLHIKNATINLVQYLPSTSNLLFPNDASPLYSAV